MSIYCPLSEALGINPPPEPINYSSNHYFDASVPNPFKGQKHTKEARERISRGLQGKSKSDSHKENLSKSAKIASKNSDKPQGRPKGSGKDQVPWHKGKTNIYSEEVLKSKSEKMKGVKNPMYGKSAWTGKKHSDETLAKMREARRLYWAKRRGECV